MSEHPKILRHNVESGMQYSMRFVMLMVRRDGGNAGLHRDMEVVYYNTNERYYGELG